MVLEKLDLTLKGATITGMVAPNGSGKTTLLRILAGQYRQPAECLSIDGIKPQQQAKYLRKLFFAEDAHYLDPALNALDYLLYVKKMWRSGASIVQLAEQTGVAAFCKKPIRTLSLGMKQQLIIALCLASDAPYILLDEPMNGLDPTNTQTVSLLLRKMRREGKAILMSSHLLTNIDALADEVIFLKDGKIAQHLTGDRIDSAATYRALYLTDSQENLLC
ncbi:MAG: ABC transporter ATP-binding protein [Coriobacteriales bacterium]|nr:ABC transporter ATP-binding protein [Coriobacteriales bacterium]